MKTSNKGQVNVTALGLRAVVGWIREVFGLIENRKYLE